MNRLVFNFTLAMLIAVILPHEPLCYAICLGMFAALYLLIRIKCKSHVAASCLLGFAVGMIVSLHAGTAESMPMYPLLNQKASCSVEVSSVPSKTDGGYTKFVGRVHSVNGLKSREKAMVYVKNGDDIRVNEIVELENVQITLPGQQQNFGGFDYRKYLSGKNIYFVLYAKAENISGRAVADMNLRRLAVRANQVFCEAIDSRFNQDTAPVLKGIFLGDKTDVPKEVTESFRNSGLSHVMAVSGLHLTILVMLLGLLLKKVPKVARGILLMLVAVLFSFVAGLTPSIIRATAMLAFVTFADMMNREADALTSMSWVALVLILLNPNVIYDTGFVLSFGATLGIVCLYGRLKRRVPHVIPGFLSDAVLITFSAQIGTLPFMIINFGQLSMIGVFSNLIIGIFLPVLIASSILAILIPLPVLIGVTEFLVFLLTKWASFCASIPGQLVYVPSNALIIISLLGICALLFISGRREWLKYKIGASALLCVLLICGIFSALKPPANTELTYLNVDQGDCALLQTTDGKSFLIDTGTAYQGETEISDYLLRNGIYKLDGIFISHFHEDHAGGLLPLLRKIKTDALYVPHTMDASRLQTDIMEYAKSEGIPVQKLAQGDVIHFPSVQFTVLYPARATEKDDNNSSMALRVDNFDVSAMFMGDLEKDYRVENCDTDLLKVSHHGSSNGSTKAFLEKCTPHISVISVGENNMYGLPKEKTLEKLTEVNSEIYRTDQHGTVKIVCDDQTYSVQTLR